MISTSHKTINPEVALKRIFKNKQNWISNSSVWYGYLVFETVLIFFFPPKLNVEYHTWSIRQLSSKWNILVKLFRDQLHRMGQLLISFIPSCLQHTFTLFSICWVTFSKYSEVLPNMDNFCLDFEHLWRIKKIDDEQKKF